jgi:ABC-2 type transport system ATP-binding protein
MPQQEGDKRTMSSTTLEPDAVTTAESSVHSDDPIVLASLTHDYGSRLALDHLSFSVAPAQIFGLLGPNGSGKTTLFRILSTLMIPSGGLATIRGFNVATEPAQVRQQTGIVFQARSLDIKLTVEENLRHAGHLYGLSGKHLRARIADVLQRVALTDRAKDYVETLSGGMQRRVELAKGLIHSPAVLLLDEPTTGLDPGARLDLWQYLRMLRDEEGVTVLVTTHMMEEAEYCDRLAILSEGKLVALGSPEQLKSTIGGDVVLFETENENAAQSLAARMAGRLEVAPTVLGNTVRLERENGHRFLTAVLDAFPGEVRAVSVSRPRLEDVFIQRTGHRFWTYETGNPDATDRSVKEKEGID